MDGRPNRRNKAAFANFSCVAVVGTLYIRLKKELDRIIVNQG